jgi:hypothetical protein
LQYYGQEIQEGIKCFELKQKRGCKGTKEKMGEIEKLNVNKKRVALY